MTAKKTDSEKDNIAVVLTPAPSHARELTFIPVLPQTSSVTVEIHVCFNSMSVK